MPEFVMPNSLLVNLISTYSFLNSPIHFHSYILSTNVYWVPTISSPVFYIHIISVAAAHPMAS